MKLWDYYICKPYIIYYDDFHMQVYKEVDYMIIVKYVTEIIYLPEIY